MENKKVQFTSIAVTTETYEFIKELSNKNGTRMYRVIDEGMNLLKNKENIK